jgi:hypothetical protein
MPLLKRTADDILQDAMKRIAANTPITNFKAGAIARAIIESMVKDIGSNPDQQNLYDFAEQVLNVGFLSRATNEYLDLIGQLFSYPRRQVSVYDSTTGQTSLQLIDDTTYRYEISQRVLTIANANYESLRLALLNVAGVADIIGREYTHGTGSFSFMIIPEFGFSLSAIKGGCEAALDRAKAFGIKRNVILPTQIPLDLRIQLVFQESATTNERDKTRLDVKTLLYQYFGGFTMGQGFIYNDFVQQVMDVNPKISDFTVIKFYLNNEPTLLTNQSIYEDEMIVPTYIEVV